VRRSVRAALVLVLIGVGAMFTAARGPGGAIAAAVPTDAASTSEPPSGRPNIVLLLTDDQRASMIDQQPNLASLVAGQGTTFTNGFVVNALCCPSRATIFTGRYSHSTGVYTNGYKHGGFAAFDDDSTIATWLDAAGYRTGLVGKYLNGYKDPTYLPPGWDLWRAVVGDIRYYDYSVAIDGVAQHFGTEATDYSTDVFAGMADDFIRSTPSDEPLFLYLAPKAPHGKPIPAERDVNVRVTLPPRPLNFNEADLSDKPAWVQGLPLQKWTGDAFVRQMYRTMFAVDDAIGEIAGALADTGRLSNTLFVVMSDNGWSQGSHRWVGKRVAWEESIRVPLMIRYDPITQGAASTDGHLALNLDIAQTIASIAGVDAPGAEGSSLVPLLGGGYTGDWRSDFLIEHWAGAKSTLPPYCAVRSETAKYIRYKDGSEELYDLVADPFELRSLNADPAYADLLATMRARLIQLCSPPPPGYTLPSA
jgi:arylsulfatase A-like enzyme